MARYFRQQVELAAGETRNVRADMTDALPEGVSLATVNVAPSGDNAADIEATSAAVTTSTIDINEREDIAAGLAATVRLVGTNATAGEIYELRWKFTTDESPAETQYWYSKHPCV